MNAKGNAVAGVKAGALALLAALMVALAVAPGATAAKIDNPSPPNFRAEVTGGFLQFVGSAGTPLQLPLDFATFDPPLPNPTLTGTITTNAERNGVINIPQAGIVFPPIPVDVGDISLTVRLLPVGNATGFIDPLSGRVDLNVPIRLKAEGSALGQSLGGNCFIGSAGSPINLGTATHNGAFPSTSSGVYVADFSPSDGFTGGWLAAEPYSDEPGSWALQPKLVPGKPVGGANGKPLPSEIPFNALTDFIPRSAGAWRGMNETLAAPAATGCGTGLAAGIVNGQVNDLIGLPSQAGASTASLDFRFNVFNERPVAANAIVQKAVKSRFVAPGVSQSPWPGTQVPTAVSAQDLTIDASTSYFKVGGNATERYAFDFGTGTFGPWTTNPVASFIAPTLAEGAPPVFLPIRVRVKDSEGDIDINTRTLRVVPATDISVTSAVSSVAGAKFRGGSPAQIAFSVTNNSTTDASSQSVAFSSSLPSGITLTNLNFPNAWSCSSTASSVSCSLPQAGLPAGQTAQFALSVDVATGAASPSTIQASVVMAGDPTSANDSINQPFDVVKTDLAVDLTRTTSLAANGWTPYEIAVSNVGDGLTVGATTVNVSLPPDFSYRPVGSGGAGWACSAPSDPREVVCSRGAVVAGNSSAPLLTVVANIDRNAAAIPSTVSATVSTQGDVNAFSGADTDSDTDTVAIVPDLTVDTAIAGDYVVGDPGEVTIVAINQSVVSINGPTTISSSSLPAGLAVTSVSGPGWDCSATVPGSSDISCSLAAGLAGGETSSTVTATVSVAQAAYPGVTVSSTVANAEDGFALNNSESADVVVRRLDIAIQKLAVKPFNVGIEGRYRLNVTNTGDAATVGAITVLDELPAGLRLKSASGAGWNCSNSTVGAQSVDCVLSSFLGAGVQASPIEIRVDVLDAAAEAGIVTNTAYADTARDNRSVPADDAITANNTSTVDTTAVAVDLSVDSTHPGNFRVMTEDLYSLTVRNVGFFGTDPGESVTVTDDLPAGILPIISEIEITRPGWSCVASGSDVACTLPAPSPSTSAMEPESAVTIDIPVVVTDAAADQSDNVVEVSTARDSNPVLSPNNRAVDPTTVIRSDLQIGATQTIAPRAGGIGEVDVSLDNIGSAATAAPSVVTIPLAAGTAYRPIGSTVAGWACSSPGAGTQVTCTRSLAIASGGSAPALKIRTNVSAAAPNSWSTVITASTEGEAPQRLANNSVTLSPVLEKVDLTVAKSHDPAAIKAGRPGSYTVEVSNVGNAASTGAIRVEDQVDSSFQNVSASGPGWSCPVTGNNVVCTRTPALPAGQSAPLITIRFSVPDDVAGTRDSVATVTNSSDPYPANDSGSDPIQIVASADTAVSIDQPSTMRVGDSTQITYTVRNTGTDSTSGTPSVKMSIFASSGLDPIDVSSPDSWDCSAVAATQTEVAKFDCLLADTVGPGGTSSLVAEFDVIPTADTQALTLARATTSGDINRSNDFATATSNLSGVDLQASVDLPVLNPVVDLTAGETGRRIVTVRNVGTSNTTALQSLRVPLPDGVQWDSGATGAGGPGWSCQQQARDIVCNRTDQLLAGATAPPLNIDLRASRSNAPSITVNYVAETIGDEDGLNDVATRTDTVLYFPQTTITSAPSGSTTSRSGSVAFDSDDDAATFECRLGSDAFAPCTSPLELSGLSLGVTTVAVRAVNERSMADQTPATANWTVTAIQPTGPNTGVKLDLTGGSLSLAALGSVPLEPNLIKLAGRRYTDTGALLIPKEDVSFQTIVQSIPDVLGPGTVVQVEISITATGDGLGSLPAGGGPATLTLPVRADVQAKLGPVSVIPPGTECALNPVTFDLNGTYDEGAKTVSLASSSVAFPQVTGCGSFQQTIDTLLELPRNDISIAMDFALEDVADGEPKLAKPVVRAPKSVKSGKPVTLTARVSNIGNAPATNVRVCFRAVSRTLIRGRSNVCRTITSIDGGKTGSTRQRFATKSGEKGKRVRFQVTATYKAADGSTKRLSRGHVTVLK